MDLNNLEDQYMEYIQANARIGNGTMLIDAFESGNYLEDFCDSIGITIEQYEGAI